MPISKHGNRKLKIPWMRVSQHSMMNFNIHMWNNLTIAKQKILQWQIIMIFCLVKQELQFDGFVKQSCRRHDKSFSLANKRQGLKVHCYALQWRKLTWVPHPNILFRLLANTQKKKTENSLNCENFTEFNHGFPQWSILTFALHKISQWQIIILF